MPEIPDRLSLADLASPQQFEVTAFDLPEQDVMRMKVLGICPGRKIRLVQGGAPMIVEVYGACIGVSRRLAAGVWVEIVPEKQDAS